MPYDRLQRYLDELTGLGLVTAAPGPRPTEKGRRLVERFESWQAALREAGLHRR